ncbi:MULTISPECIES: Holliday junction resolvase RuvX [unclassified Corynebacterium]|uniref:Holliday junction resolvase RuvX n=1 Tax=unclassified Corynebacterium TaxID=2624378 RepID=UPI0029CA9E3B|nr:MULTISPECIES: Holliday junction resolvase RuvX [unclassified Corynebacterium]WPF65172.1 Holliday junction resolvase RuvX [Corynebacterium sp. 22KM0430]WPF67668.1 Holliday junction resolvase RuvX [Corynebacterium sp. 21KM1197]
MAVRVDTPGANDPGAGRRVGIDVGTVRIGVAVSDRAAMLATPVETVPRETGLGEYDQGDIDRLMEIIESYEAVEVIVGLPRDLKGNGSISVKHAKDIAFRIRRRLREAKNKVPVRLADERLTTVAATQALQASGVSAKKGRAFIDQAAAVEILQTWLDGRAYAIADDEEKSQ